MTQSASHHAWPHVAVIGCGYWGKNLVRNFAQLGRLAALVDHHTDHVGALIAQHGGTAASFGDVLSNQDIQAVVIATPGPSHVELGSRALNAGKHVYIEKPLAMDAQGAQALVDLAAKNNRILMVGHILRYHPAFMHVEQMVKDGALGRIRHVISTRFNLGKILSDEDVIWSLAPHDISMVTALLGQDPHHVRAHGNAFLRPGVADIATIRLGYADNVSAEIRLSWMSATKEHKLTVIGEKATLIFDDLQPWEQKLTLRTTELDWSDPAVIPPQGMTQTIALEPGEPLKNECMHFLDCCASGAAPKTDGREGLAVTRILERVAAELKI